MSVMLLVPGGYSSRSGISRLGRAGRKRAGSAHIGSKHVTSPCCNIAAPLSTQVSIVGLTGARRYHRRYLLSCAFSETVLQISCDWHATLTPTATLGLPVLKHCAQRKATHFLDCRPAAENDCARNCANEGHPVTANRKHEPSHAFIRNSLLVSCAAVWFAELRLVALRLLHGRSKVFCLLYASVALLSLPWLPFIHACTQRSRRHHT